MKKMPYLIPLIILTLFFGCHHPEAKALPLPQVQVMQPIVKTVDLYQSYVGHVQPFLQVEIKAQVEGILTGAFFKEGDEVAEGDLLFTIDSRPYFAQLKKAEGALAESIASLRYSEDVASRNAPLVQEDYVSQVQYDQYLTNILTYKGAIKQNEAEIDTAKINISYCEIKAPMRSVTGKIQLQVGNLIPNVGETPLVVLNQITPTYTYFSVPQKDLANIMNLHRAKKLTTIAYRNGDENKPYYGTLDLIDNQVNDQTGSIWLRGIFPNEDKELWPGEFVDIHLIMGVQNDAILVPTEAISYGQNGKYLFVIKQDNTAEIRWVQTGQRFDNLTLITEGLGKTDRVVVKGQINLANKTKVQIKEGS